MLNKLRENMMVHGLRVKIEVFIGTSDGLILTPALRYESFNDRNF